ncbi:hypothetical protein FPZ24_02000 [Sphingomonas panacisoli]|uniref:DUF4402 domain-containing protein n=1 Tax=Sphingomonas panacisoli TaxID=1813879 RepID=A0A5B8LEM0_9SPHN|nr:hypothetical protein [Sphingomonas panacisoli]QDZ06396.1 hypothetical protein FPZ24_02000 [Sphingomonas panacisoli]
MKYVVVSALVGAALVLPVFAQTAPVINAVAVVLPADTVVAVTPVEEISSKKMKEGETRKLQVANDVVEKGVVIIPRGAPVTATVSWRTGKGIGGKSAKFELTFNSVTVRGKDYALKGKHRQEGKGNTVGALLGSMWISGHSAVMASGQVVNAFTAEPIPAS